MLAQQNIQFSFYSGLYDLIVPKDNFLRKINDLIDFSFIYNQLLRCTVRTTDIRPRALSACSSTFYLRRFFTISDVDVVERTRYL